jgi:hypothetical protein
MWSALINGYAVLLAILVTYTTYIATSNMGKRRRADAFRVLKLLWISITGASGLIALLIRLYNSGHEWLGLFLSC